MTLGSIDYMIRDVDYARLLNRLTKEKMIYSDLHEENGCLKITISFEHSFRFEKMCHLEGYKPCKTDIHGMLRFYKSLYTRPGLIFGTLLSALLMAYYSNVILTITVDTDDPAIYGKVMDVLDTDGVKPGAYLPDIDLVLEERSLKRQIDDISWVGISRTGSGIAIDVIENIRSDRGITVGMPCHLVACEDGIIEEIELIDGQLMKCLGSGVTKGEIVVSGKIVTDDRKHTEHEGISDSNTRYVRSIGKIRGTFTRTMVFEQPYDTEQKVMTGKKKKLHYLEILSAKIPLFGKNPDGYFEAEKEMRHFPEIGGFMIPVGVSEIRLNEYDIRSQVLEEDEALSRAEKSAFRYEQNFLDNYEIKGRRAESSKYSNGIRLTVTYELYGDLCRESDFFIPKYIIHESNTHKKENVQDSENY